MKKLILLSLLVIMFCSCSTRKGYGCHGRESWNNLIKRINRP